MWDHGFMTVASLRWRREFKSWLGRAGKLLKTSKQLSTLVWIFSNKITYTSNNDYHWISPNPFYFYDIRSCQLKWRHAFHWQSRARAPKDSDWHFKPSGNFSTMIKLMNYFNCRKCTSVFKLLTPFLFPTYFNLHWVWRNHIKRQRSCKIRIVG